MLAIWALVDLEAADPALAPLWAPASRLQHENEHGQEVSIFSRRYLYGRAIGTRLCPSVVHDAYVLWLNGAS